MARPKRYTLQKNFQIGEDERRILAELADQEHCTESEVIRRALWEHYKQTIQPTEPPTLTP